MMMMMMRRHLQMLRGFLVTAMLLAIKVQSRRNLEDAFEYDLADFSLRFEKCQFVKMFDEDVADTMLALKHFVVFRLCDSCSSCDVYGTYTMEVDEYLETTIQQQQKILEQQCADCPQDCADDDDDDACGDCSSLCYQNDNDDGYLDAANYVNCQAWEGNSDDDDDDGVQYYIGPRCDNDSISIGVFSDENCWEPVSMDVETLLGQSMSYHLLRHTYSDSQPAYCLSCQEDAADENDDVQDADNVNEMCENVYERAAKCESETGLENGFVNVNREEENYENQVENEFMACTFINSLLWDSYTETGEINHQDIQDVIVRQVTQLQAVALTGLTVLCGLLVLAMRYLTQEIGRVSPPPVLMANTDSKLT